jgi:hypothetical protein
MADTPETDLVPERTYSKDEIVDSLQIFIDDDQNSFRLRIRRAGWQVAGVVPRTRRILLQCRFFANGGPLPTIEMKYIGGDNFLDNDLVTPLFEDYWEGSLPQGTNRGFQARLIAKQPTPVRLRFLTTDRIYGT